MNPADLILIGCPIPADQFVQAAISLGAAVTGAVTGLGSVVGVAAPVMRVLSNFFEQRGKAAKDQQILQLEERRLELEERRLELEDHGIQIEAVKAYAMVLAASALIEIAAAVSLWASTQCV